MSNQQFTLMKISTGAELAVTSDLLVGRNAESDLKLVEGNPSGKHALLSISDGSVWVHDLHSKNGTYVNDRRIDSKIKLASNDRLRFDAEEYLIRIDSESRDDDHTVARAANDDTTSVSRRLPPAWIAIKQTDSRTRLISQEEMGEERERIRKRVLHDYRPGRIDTPLLIFSVDADEPRHIQLRDVESRKRQQWTVGSDDNCNIQLQISGVSGLHAMIVKDGKQWKVIDQLSANGIFVNGRRTPMSYLKSDDLIAFGTVECRFYLPRSAMAEAAAAGGGHLKHGLEWLHALFTKFRSS
jgi:pSer/pThr/pTyr-binding forkhead associated (FHA) protein